MSRTPPWLTYAKYILEGMADELRSTHSNQKTFNITASCAKTLLAGFPLSEAQRKVFLDNIRKRIPGRASFVWNEDIVLTKRQRLHARTNKSYADLIAFIDSQNSWTKVLQDDVEGFVKGILANANLTQEQQHAAVTAFREHLMNFSWSPEAMSPESHNSEAM